MATYGSGTPMKIGGINSWRGIDRTNGFLMRNADGRLPATQDSFADIIVDGSLATATAGAIPWGHALFMDQALVATKPGTVYTSKPTKGILTGVIKFDQGIATGHPVQNWGLMEFGKGVRIRNGLVGYKQTMTAVGREAQYLDMLKGDVALDVDANRHLYANWVAAWAAGTAGHRLALFFGNASGYPIMTVVASGSATPALANATFGGYVEILEPENQTAFVRIDPLLRT